MLFVHCEHTTFTFVESEKKQLILEKMDQNSGASTSSDTVSTDKNKDRLERLSKLHLLRTAGMYVGVEFSGYK